MHSVKRNCSGEARGIMPRLVECWAVNIESNRIALDKSHMLEVYLPFFRVDSCRHHVVICSFSMERTC